MISRWMVLGLAGCLERVTGEAVPLDERFYAAMEAGQGQPGQGGGSAIPFGGYAGETVMVRGTVASPVGAEGTGVGVDLDVRVPDPQAEGGIDPKGKLLLEGPGSFELAVPRGLGRLELQAFQDLDGDGPSAPDPFASAWLEVGEVDVEGVVLEMVVGAGSRGGGGPVHAEAPPGAPGGAPHPGGTAGGAVPAHDPSAQGSPPTVPGPGVGGITPFLGYEGPMVTISGTLACASCPMIDLDLFQPAGEGQPQQQGGRKLLGKLKVAPGAYTLQVPRDFGPILLEAFYDAQGNGPSAGDPMGRYPNNPLRVGRSDLSGVDITLEVSESGMMPGDAPKPPRPPGGGGISRWRSGSDSPGGDRGRDRLRPLVREARQRCW